MEAGTIPGAVRNQLRAIFKQDAAADRVALVWQESLAEPEVRLTVENTPVRLIWCPSELALRERLVQHTPGAERLVALVPLDGRRLGRDVVARLWRYEPQRINPWSTLEELLGVRRIDPRVRRHRWLGECLVDNYERYADRVAFGMVLDRDTAWQALALALLDYGEKTVDWPALFRWSVQDGAKAAIDALPGPVSEHLGEWLSLHLPDDAQLVRMLWAGGHAGNMLALGVVCSVLYRSGMAVSQNVLMARGRFAGRFFSDASVDQAVLARFGEAAEAFVRENARGTSLGGLSPVLTTAEQTLSSLELLHLAVDSDVLPEGLRQRLEEFAKALKQGLGSKPLAPLYERLERLRNHQLAPLHHDRIARAEMAARVCAWLQRHPPQSEAPLAVIAEYVASGSYVDWARSQLWQGDPNATVDRVYRQVTQKATQRREAFNERFAGLLPGIARGDQWGDAALPVEQALARVVAPLAEQSRVLLLVLDGMSLAVFRELATDLAAQNWVALRRDAIDDCACLLAALPTRTATSRYSLLAGALGEGAAADEKKAFAANASLKAYTSTRFPPLLFHKGDLTQQGSGALASSVREYVAGTEHRVVGAVINAVDDHLAGGSQINVRWRLENVTVLRQLLEAARESGRVVVMTSDHGHVLDHDMEYRNGSGDNERFRPGSGTAAADEVRVSGPRVLTDDGAAVLPWSEKVRYCPKKVGYHGGGSPQEVIIPLGVFRFAGESQAIPGWRESPQRDPAWWRLTSGAEQPPAAKPAKSEPGPVRDLFTPKTETRRAEKTHADDALFALFRSPTFGQMRKRAGRTALSDEQLGELLRVLEAAGGQQMFERLAQQLRIPAIRLRGFLAGAQKLLNVDGYPVLSVDHASRTVRLDRASMKQQFEL